MRRRRTSEGRKPFPSWDFLTISIASRSPRASLDPLPTGRATAAIAQLCEHLTATQTRYPGTNLILRYEIKTSP
jgi:hypothetical protein